MLSTVLSIGNKIEMEKVVHGVRVEQPVRYVSQLLDIFDRRQMKIAMPIIRERIVPLDIGDLYYCVFFTQKGLYRCQCEIVDRYRDENVYYAVVKQQSDLERYQRREYYRLNCLIDAYARQISKEEEICLRKLRLRDFENDDEYWKCMAKLDGIIKEWKKITITDVSGGGARFNSSMELEQGENIYTKISFVSKNRSYEYELMSRVIVSAPVEQKAFSFETRVEFQTISNKERENIIQFIFEEERKNRQIASNMR